MHGNDIAVEAQRAKLRLMIETAQEVGVGSTRQAAVLKLSASRDFQTVGGTCEESRIAGKVLRTRTNAMNWELTGDITNHETFAEGSKIRELHRLVDSYGGKN